jgi:hypothetical protein
LLDHRHRACFGSEELQRAVVGFNERFQPVEVGRNPRSIASENFILPL